MDFAGGVQLKNGGTDEHDDGAGVSLSSVRSGLLSDLAEYGPEDNEREPG